MKTISLYAPVIAVLGLAVNVADKANAQTANHSETTTQVIEVIKMACATGTQTNFSVNADGGLSIIKRGAEGSINVTAEEINGVVRGTSEEIRKEENENIRQCMQQYVPKLIDYMLNTRERAPIPKQAYQLTSQRLSVDLPLPIIDGAPMIIVEKIYENGSRHKAADLKLDIPHRRPQTLRFDLDLPKRNSKTFEYRDNIYKINVEHINLQDQIVTLSVRLYRDNSRSN